MSSVVSSSIVSETDIKVFAELTNPSKTNLEKLRMEANRAAELRSVEEVEEEDKQSGSSSNDDDDDADRNNESREQDEGDDAHDDEDSDASDASDANGTRKSGDTSDHDSDSDESDEAHPVSAPQRAASSVSSLADIASYTHRSQRAASSVVSTSSSAHQARQSMKASPFLNRMDERTETTPRLDAAFRPPEPIRNTFASANEGETLEKQQILLDMENLRLQGVKMSKTWTLDDRLEDMLFEMRRLTMSMEEQNNISMMKDALKFACSGIEMISTRYRLLELNGWSNDVCSNMARYDNALGRLYRKYWKKGFSTSPEMEITMSIVGSIGMYHFKQRLQKSMVPPNAYGQYDPFARKRSTKTPVASTIESDSDDEAPPT